MFIAIIKISEIYTCKSTVYLVLCISGECFNDSCSSPAVVAGRFPVTRELAAELGALMAQLDAGDHCAASAQHHQALAQRFYPYRYRAGLSSDELRYTATHTHVRSTYTRTYYMCTHASHMHAHSTFACTQHIRTHGAHMHKAHIYTHSTYARTHTHTHRQTHTKNKNVRTTCKGLFCRRKLCH